MNERFNSNNQPLGAIKDYLQVTQVTAPSYLDLPLATFQVNIEPKMILVLPLFYGREDENPL